MIVKLLTEHHLEFLSLKVGCRGSSESTLVKMSNVGNLVSQLILMYDYLILVFVKMPYVCLSSLMLFLK